MRKKLTHIGVRSVGNLKNPKRYTILPEQHDHSCSLEHTMKNVSQ